MRLRLVVLASLLTALAAGTLPAVGQAAPRHNHGLTINVIPHSIQAGDDVTIYGRLKGTNASGQTIVLYQHLDGFGGGYTKMAQTTTRSGGFYEFPESNVLTNRSWFVAGPDNTHSRTVFERVAAQVSTPVASSPDFDTNRPFVFTGSVTPPVHAGDRVLLQQQINGSDDWRTLEVRRLNRASDYRFVYRFRTPGERDIRVVFRGDHRNIKGVSDAVSVTIQQAEVRGFTITSSSRIINYGSLAVISGVLDQPGTTTPESGKEVVLCGRTADQRRFACSQVTTTGSNGSYSFTVAPPQDELYQVRPSLPPKRRTAVLFEGVRDIVTMGASSTTSTVGGTVTFSGTVTPNKAGHVIYLQRLGKDNEWHTVKVTLVRSNSTYLFTWTFRSAGSRQFRARITSDEHDVGAASPPVTMSVGSAPASSLPPAT
jgi:hypothetical protein